MIRRLRRFARDRRGATIVEFAIVVPVMVMVMMGLGDMLYQAYVQSVLNGAVQKAGRDSGLEGGDTQANAIDAKVQASVRSVVANATFPSITRKSYDRFAEVAPEPFTDGNGNGRRDAGECYTDVNGNRAYDLDPGTSGQGGASAIVLYTVTANYRRIFPVARLLGFPATQTVSASTLLRNQPYLTRTETADATICTP